MKLIISGTEYDVGNIGKASLADLMALKSQTGMGVAALREGLANAKRLKDLALDDEQALLALGALIFLTRRRAGEKVSFEEACSFPLDELEVVAEDGDSDLLAGGASESESEAPDPRSPGSAREGSGGARGQGKGRSTTSKRRS